MNNIIFRTRYRIVRDSYAGYEVQFRHWWMPFYLQCGFTNTHSSVERARAYVEARKHPVVEQF